MPNSRRAAEDRRAAQLIHQKALQEAQEASERPTPAEQTLTELQQWLKRKVEISRGAGDVHFESNSYRSASECFRAARAFEETLNFLAAKGPRNA